MIELDRLAGALLLWRRHRGLTQAEWGALIDMSPRTVHSYESGSAPNMRVVDLLRLMEHCGVKTLVEFLNGPRTVVRSDSEGK